MDQPRPQPFKVENRSERVYVFGFLRMIPFGIWVTGIVFVVFLGSYVRAHPAVVLSVTALVLIGPVVLDRSTLFDPVDFVTFSDVLFIKRLVKRKTYPLDRVLQIEIEPSEGNDYDDRSRGRPLCVVTIRLRGAWPARFLATQQQAVSIARWAEANELKVTGIDTGTIPE